MIKKTYIGLHVNTSTTTLNTFLQPRKRTLSVVQWY